MKRRKFFGTFGAVLLSGFLKVPKIEDLLSFDEAPKVFYFPRQFAKSYVHSVNYSIGFQVTGEMMKDSLYEHGQSLTQLAEETNRLYYERFESQTKQLYNGTWKNSD